MLSISIQNESVEFPWQRLTASRQWKSPWQRVEHPDFLTASSFHYFHHHGYQTIPSPLHFSEQGHTLNYSFVWRTAEPHRRTHSLKRRHKNTTSLTGLWRWWADGGRGLINFQMTDWSHPPPLNEVSLGRESFCEVEVNFCSALKRLSSKRLSVPTRVDPS